MLIRKIDESTEYPSCPKCKVPLYREGMEFTDEQVKKMAEQADCKHSNEWVSFGRCNKCDYYFAAQFYPAARLMRCPKCAKLYHVEEE